MCHVLARRLEEVGGVGQLHHEPWPKVLENAIRPLLVALLLDELGDGEGGLVLVFRVLDILSQVFDAHAVDPALGDEIDKP